jgi:putative flippase GtrA
MNHEPQPGVASPAEEPVASPAEEPVVSFTEEPVVPSSRLRRTTKRIAARLSAAQFLRYLMVGVFNTVFGYTTFALTLHLLTHLAPQRYLYLTVIAASVLCTPLNITVAYFGYKLFVFKTRGNYLREWLKCFGVYGVGMLPGLLVLSALTRLLQAFFHAHSAAMHADLISIAPHVHGGVSALVQKLSHGKAAAGYIAGAMVQSFTVIFSFIGHKRVTFAAKDASSAS